MPAGENLDTNGASKGAIRYWRVRTALEVAKFTLWTLWEVIKHRF
ncbi:hypothetical protein [Actinomadura bangladeshensis]|nr:hypothetical protein [Actinomadura bangladeshensis]